MNEINGKKWSVMLRFGSNTTIKMIIFHWCYYQNTNLKRHWVSYTQMCLCDTNHIFQGEMAQFFEFLSIWSCFGNFFIIDEIKWKWDVFYISISYQMPNWLMANKTTSGVQIKIKTKIIFIWKLRFACSAIGGHSII